MSFAVRREVKSNSRGTRIFTEAVEPRRLLSVAVIQSSDVVRGADAPSSVVQGDTPAQVRNAYGFDQLGGTTANGLGQTIAIIDPYNDPAVFSDLNIFDAKFGIQSPPNFKVVNSNGGSSLPATNGGWAGEIATDVEWAHAIAPAAGIILVEAQSDNTDDLMAAVNYARSLPAVSVVSISWGGGEFSGQTSYDSDFTTPSGHQGITYVVASGDNGAQGGAQWPASSPNVVSVGGTVLTIADQTGAYGGETSWFDSSGGYSKFETEPSWQQDVQSTGARSMPDVAYDADVNTGLALYDSIKYQGIVGWQTTGGTSVARTMGRHRRHRRSGPRCRRSNNPRRPNADFAVLYSLYARQTPPLIHPTRHISTTSPPATLARLADFPRPATTSPPDWEAQRPIFSRKR